MFATQPYRRICDDHRKPPARYSAMCGRASRATCSCYTTPRGTTPGAKVTEVARRNGVAASVVFTWRRQARTIEQVGPRFAPVQIAAAKAVEENSKPSSSNRRPSHIRYFSARRG
jgi:hypothetical protein